MNATDDSLRGRRLHFVAIGGAGMSGLALVCHRLGATVTGSDRAESSYLERLRAAGIEPRIGHDPGAVPADAVLVVSTAVPADNPELVWARERGQRVVHRGELLAEVCAAKRLIAVAGAHGKTTTAGMIVHALRAAGADPAFLLGGELPGAAEDGGPANAGWGTGEWIIAEADESDASFLRLEPEVAVITNVELDHHSHWSSLGELLDAFRRFAEPAAAVAVPIDPRLDSVASAPERLRFAVAAGSREESSKRADLTAVLGARRPGGWSFELRGSGRPIEAAVAVPGRHNVANAVAALAALHLAAGRDSLPPLADCARGLADFGGMARRLELKGTVRGARVYDDYAHHPTEIAASLAALRELDPRRLVAVFQPHLYSRTRALARRFGAALAAADEIGVVDVYPAREEPVGELAGVSGLDVARAAAEHAGGRPVWWLRELDAARRALAPGLGVGDLLVTLGAGDVFTLAEALVGERDDRGEEEGAR